MGELLDELLKEIVVKDKKLDQQVIELCETIWNQEKDTIPENIVSIIPQGSNILLALPCPGLLKGDIAFLTLEREMKETYVAGMWVIKKDKLMRSKVWNIKEVNCKRILTKYAEILKYLKGE